MSHAALNAMIDAYVVAMLWSSVGEDGEPLDKDFDFDDLTPRCAKACAVDCAVFLQTVAHILPADIDYGQVGHDFWLTRNGHGAGFWDRPEVYGGQDIADLLTKIAGCSRELHCYVTAENEVDFE